MPAKKDTLQELSQDPLSRKHRLFVTEYERDRQPHLAAIRAGYSKKSARQAAHELMNRPDIAAEIRRVDDAYATAVGNIVQTELGEWAFERNRVLRQIAIGCFADPRDLFDADGAPKPIHEMSAEQASLIEGIEVFEVFGPAKEEGGGRTVVGRTFKYKIARRQPWADMLMKHLGEYAKDNKQKGEANANMFASLVSEMKSSTLPVVKAPSNEPDEPAQAVH